MKTLADFKRELKSHKGPWYYSWECDGLSGTGLRKVVHVQSNAVAFWRESGAGFEAAKANPHRSATWLLFPKARDCSFEGNKIIIQAAPGFIMTYEKLLI